MKICLGNPDIAIKFDLIKTSRSFPWREIYEKQENGTQCTSDVCPGSSIELIPNGLTNEAVCYEFEKMQQHPTQDDVADEFDYFHVSLIYKRK
jgi:hypothetical protein